jgi:hypothetical protein
MVRQMLNRGVTMEITGKIDTPSAVVRMTRFPGKSRRAMAYAARVASTTATAVAMSEMPIEFRRAERKRSWAAPSGERIAS